MEYEEFRDIVGSAVTTLAATNVHGTQKITSTNGVLPGSSYPNYSYPYAIGIKTGHTSVAGYCLVSAADKDGRRLLCVVMGCGSRTASFSQTIRLFDWGYDNYDALTYGVDVPDPDLPDESDNQDSTLENEEEPELISAQETVAPSPTQTIIEVPAVSAEVSELTPTPSVSPAVNTNIMLPIFMVLIISALLIVVLLVVLVILLIRRRR